MSGMTGSDFAAIISDLGNVVIDYSFDRAFTAWGRIYNRNPEELKDRFDFGKPFHALERGDMADGAFIAHAGRMLDIDFTRQGFLAGWEDIYIGLKPGVIDLLRSYQGRYRLVALTNTTALHEVTWEAKFGETLHELFERIFMSDKIRARKPEARAYEIVLDYLGVGPEQVIYLDDNPEFIKGAEALGIRSLLVSTRDEIEIGLSSALGLSS